MSCRLIQIAPGTVGLVALLTACAPRIPPAEARNREPGKEAWAGLSTVAIRIDRPMVVGFFPNVTQAEIDADDSLQSAVEHFISALQDTAKCMEASGIPVPAACADRIIFREGNSRSEVSLNELSNESIGCAMLAPNRKPRLVRASAGPSSLILLCPAAASLYFTIPACCPQGFKCCPDGNVVGEDHPCEG